MNQDLIIRLSKYKRLLHKLKALGLERVFSNNLGDAIGISPSLVRKDFSILNLPGNKRGGYEINYLIAQLGHILGKDQPQDVIIVGCGRIGTALMKYDEFASEGIRVIAGFDINPENVRKVRDIPIYHISEIQRFVESSGVRVGIISVPDTAASQILEMMIQAGIRGILNFASVELKQTCADSTVNSGCCIIQNVNIGLELEQLFYQINAFDAGRQEESADEPRAPELV